MTAVTLSSARQPAHRSHDAPWWRTTPHPGVVAAHGPAGFADVVRSISRMNDYAEILESVPQLVTRMGFDRAIMSEIIDGSWLPSSVYVPRDIGWAQEIRDVGRESPQPLGGDMTEDELIRTGGPIVVRHVVGNPRVNQAIATVSQSAAYLATPIRVGDEVAGFIHVDRYFTGDHLGRDDAANLQAVSDTIGLTIERAVLRRQLRERSDSGPAAVSTDECSDATLVEGLTPKEQEVAAMIADGLTNPQIARELVIAEATVKTHVKHVLRKAGARHRAELVSMLLRAVR